MYGEQLRILVTGSSRMDVYRRGGDGLMGRYFLSRMHPFSVAEIFHKTVPDPARIVRPPKEPKTTDYQALWFKNVSRSLRRERKWFLRDWASIEDPGDKAETFIACLLKAVEGWNDMGFGDFALGYLRDKERREVDFLVARDGRP